MLRIVIFSAIVLQLISSDEIINCPCGREGASTRIINGSPVGKGKYPWMIALLKQNPSGDSYYLSCGATLINNQWLLTAAHCVSNSDPSDITAVRSQVDIDNVDESHKMKIDKIWTHPEYKGKQTHFHHDIALLRLSSPVRFTVEIAPVCLPTKNMRTFGNLFNIGWGRTSDQISSDHSMYIETNDLSHECIKESAEYSLYGNDFGEKQICTLIQNKGISFGDSGGPLSTRKNGYVTQVGINSYIIGGACGKYQDVLTRVSEYLDDIYQITAGSTWCRNPNLEY